MLLIYGFYRITPMEVSELMAMARRAGIRHFDTAQLYGNERACADAILPGEAITTKLFDPQSAAQTKKRVYRSLIRFTSRLSLDGKGAKIDCFLLHRPMPPECWLGLVTECPDVASLGISNYDREELEQLLAYCQEHYLRTPEIHQMEVHPFVDCLPMIQFCQTRNIRVQGHTVLTQQKFFHYPPLMELAKRCGLSVPTVLIAWAASKDIDLVITTRNSDHLQELIVGSKIQLPAEAIAEMDQWHLVAPHRFYPSSPKVIQYTDEMVERLRADLSSEYPSDLCESVPIVGDTFRTIGRQIAQMLYPELKPESGMIKLRKEIKRLRTLRVQQRKVDRNRKKGMTNAVPIRMEGEYADSILHPRPMPVSVSDPKEFIPFFAYLKAADSAPEEDQIFLRGAMFPDGRMDLCKQVVGPQSIAKLCETVTASKIVRHFLLGNNVAFQEDEVRGATAMAEMIAASNLITLYLAGNCIGPVGIGILAEALKMDTNCKALWLKRNPIHPEGCISLNSMLRVNTTLVVLDLHNCGIGNEGLQNLFAVPAEMRGLKHVYLDSNAIEILSPLVEWCKVAPVTTLSLSINRLGDAEIISLAQALMGNGTLKRLCLASTHMHNAGALEVIAMARTCPKLRSLNLGSYKSSIDLGEWSGNFFEDAVQPILADLIVTSPNLEYLNLVKCQISTPGLRALPRLSRVSIDCHACPPHHVHDSGELRRLKHPKRVTHIDSIYRGRM